MLAHTPLTVLLSGLLVAIGNPVLEAGPAQVLPKHKRGPTDFVIVAGGDVSYPKDWYERIVKIQKGRLFSLIRPILDEGDLRFCNLEGPLTNRSFAHQKRFPIAMDPRRMDWVLSAGFNMLSLANNHISDCGLDGVQDTIALLEKEKQKRFVVWTGAGRNHAEAQRPAVFRPPGKTVRVAFMAYTSGWSRYVSYLRKPRVFEEIRQAAGRADLVVVSCHAGGEYVHVPATDIREYYRGMVEAGAHVVLGHHPHVPQGVELFRGGIIVYSLGNLSFASYPARDRLKDAKMYGMLAVIEVRSAKLHQLELVPLYVNHWAPLVAAGRKLKTTPLVPQPLQGVFAAKVLMAFQRWSHRIPGNRTRIRIRGNRAVVQLTPP